MRLTKLKPEPRAGDRRGNDRGDRFNRNNDRDRRGKSQAARPRRENRFSEEQNQEVEQRPRPQRKQERFNGAKLEDFPTL